MHLKKTVCNVAAILSRGDVLREKPDLPTPMTATEVQNPSHQSISVQYLWSPGPRPTNDISIDLEIRSKFQVQWFKMYSTDHNKILHTSWQCNCCDFSKISLWSIEYIFNYSTPTFDRISNSIEMLLLGWGPGLFMVQPIPPRQCWPLRVANTGDMSSISVTHMESGAVLNRVPLKGILNVDLLSYVQWHHWPLWHMCSDQWKYSASSAPHKTYVVLASWYLL